MLQEGLKPEKTQSLSSRYSGMSRTEEKTKRHALEAPNNRAAGSLKKEKRTRRQREAPRPSLRTQAAEQQARLERPTSPSRAVCPTQGEATRKQAGTKPRQQSTKH